VLVPERTVDSLLAYELLTAFPTAILWSPTNTKGSLDHQLDVGGSRAILFECKGIEPNWRIPIRWRQLDAYVSGGFGHLLYLLPSKPTDPTAPWLRTCTHDPDGRGHCMACAASVGSDRRRWAGKKPHVRSALPERRLQPWFNHWSWCVPASQLQHFLGHPVRDVRILADDSTLAGISGAQRLCHMLPRTSVAVTQPAPSGPGTTPVGGQPGGGPFTDGTPSPPIGNGGSDAPSDGDLPEDSLPGPSFADFEIRGEEILAFWERGEEDESHHVRPGSIGLLY
jgi:hypothetical protein